MRRRNENSQDTRYPIGYDEPELLGNTQEPTPERVRKPEPELKGNFQ